MDSILYIPYYTMDGNYRYVYGPYSYSPAHKNLYPAYVYPKHRVRIVRKTAQNPDGERITLPTYQKMKPYYFRDYIPPTYYQLWDYNKKDQEEADYTEQLRLAMIQEFFAAPGTLRLQIRSRR
jgi:hypothetical protein